MNIMPTPYFYLVKDGDSASSIAQKFTKDPSRWPELVQANIQYYPTKLVSLQDGTVVTVFENLSIGQRLYLPLNWLGKSDERTVVSAVKDYGYSFDAYRHILNPRDWMHDMPFDYLLVRKIFKCVNEDQYQSNPYKTGEDARVKLGEPYLYQYYYNEKVRELWGANKDKQLINMGPSWGQEAGFYRLNLQPCDIVKIPANWPDDTKCDTTPYFDSTDNISKYRVPITGATPESSHKICIPRRNNRWSRFWTAERDTTDVTGYDAIDMLMNDSYLNACNCNQRVNDISPFLAGAGDVKPVSTGSLILDTCIQKTVNSIQEDPDAYNSLLQKYGNDEAIANAIIEKCKEFNKESIDKQLEDKKDKESSIPWLPIIGITAVLGLVTYAAIDSK